MASYRQDGNTIMADYGTAIEPEWTPDSGIIPMIDLGYADEVPDDDPFGEPSADELAEIETWQRAELATADKEAADYRNHVREQIANTGLSHHEVLSDPNIPLNEVAHICRVIGADPYNVGEVPAKPKAFTTGVERSTAALLRRGTVNTLPKPPKSGGLTREPKAATEPKAKAVPSGILPSAPRTNDREKLATWARDYCRELCDKYQSQKLHNRLFGNPMTGSQGSLAWQLDMMPKEDAKLTTWAAGARLSFDKKVGS